MFCFFLLLFVCCTTCHLCSFTPTYPPIAKSLSSCPVISSRSWFFNPFIIFALLFSLPPSIQEYWVGLFCFVCNHLVRTLSKYVVLVLSSTRCHLYPALSPNSFVLDLRTFWFFCDFGFSLYHCCLWRRNLYLSRMKNQDGHYYWNYWMYCRLCRWVERDESNHKCISKKRDAVQLLIEAVVYV